MAITKDAIPDALKRDFLPAVQQVFGSRLRSVMVYGSAATDSFVPGVSDVNVLITVDRLDARDLSLLGRKARGAFRRLRITPLILTEQEFSASADVFPMEYMDITARHVLILGEDATKDLELTRRNLRHQLEDGLRGSLAVLRQAVVACGGNEKTLARFLKSGYGTQGALLRGLLRLTSGEPVPEDRRGVIAAVERHLEVDCSAFGRLLDLREAGRGEPAHELVGSLQEALMRLIAFVDTMRL